jgi:photosystem II stability/assembly factor-like uncharacterized protein
VRKLLIPVIASFILIAAYMVSCTRYTLPNTRYFGDADALGSEEDENARYNYELMMLQDPATGKIPAHIRERELAFAATLPTDAMPSARTTALSLTWQQRGPWNVGGRTRAVAIDVTNDNIIVAGSTAGGMWRSTDKGQSWKPTTTPDQYKSVTCVVQDTRPGHQNVWYYGSGEGYGQSASETGAYYLGNGIYKSTDSGKSWTLLPSTTSSVFSTFDMWADVAWNIVIDPSDTVHSVVYAAVLGAIYKSSDGGNTWASVLGTFGTSSFTDVAITNNGVVYASISSDGPARGIYRSADGITFTNITPSAFPSGYNRVKIGISPSDERQVYFLGNTPGSGMPDTNYVGQIEWNSLWKYNYLSGNGVDTGGLWRNLSAHIPNSGGVFDKFTCQGSYDLVVKVKPNDTNVVFIGGTNLYRSTSGFADHSHTTYIGGYVQGATLPVVNMYLNHHPDQHDVVFFPGNPNRMISANDGGLFYCNDNTVSNVLWSSLNNGYITSMFYTCAIDHASTNDILIGGAQDNGSWFTNSSSLSAPWVTPRGGDGSFCSIADYGKAYYFSIQNGKVMKGKLNNSGVVDSFARIDPAGGKGYLFINPFTMDPNDNNIMYLAGGKFLWRNNNLSGIPYASNWDSISTNWFKFPDSTTVGGSITAIAVCKVPANRVYVGSSSRRVLRIDSANTGAHTMRNMTPTTFPGGYVSCIAVDPNNGDNVMVTFSNYNVYSIFYSSDGGTTWSKVAGNLEVNKSTGAGDGPSVRWASIIPTNNGTVYLAATSAGLYATTQLNDTNTVWVLQSANSIGKAVVDMIDYRATDGLTVVATHSSGMYSTHITTVNNIKQVPPPQQSFSLTNYPNPFTNQTTIRFDIKNTANVSIKMYDQMGRLVRTVAEEQMESGEKRIIFDASNLAPGMYYCNLRAGAFAETRPMLKQ